jgi:hypothetical protein
VDNLLTYADIRGIGRVPKKRRDADRVRLNVGMNETCKVWTNSLTFLFRHLSSTISRDDDLRH